MSEYQALVLTVYFGTVGILSLYGLHRYLILYLYYHSRQVHPVPQGQFAELPVVTVQLPIYNELYVVDGLLDAVAALEYPRSRLEVQVLDDSTDETVELVARKVAGLRRDGLDIVHVRRPDRKGYKAGALEYGLRSAKGALIAIFDADFRPGADLLLRTVHFFVDPQVGMVQTRWGHLNEDFSLLTRLQGMMIDGHLILEQTARNRTGRFCSFNGTAGVWRKACIEDSGGWQHDTLTEDLDLSYRAQLRGWHFVFLPEIVTPAELPADMAAFKSQQHRWAKGSVQTALKMLPSVLRARLPLPVKLEAVIHLSANLAYLLLILLCFLMFPSLSAVRQPSAVQMLFVDLPIFIAASVSVGMFYFCGQLERGRSFGRIFWRVPLLLGLGVGMSINNGRAVIEALLGLHSGFTRTPKFGTTQPERGPRRAPSLQRYLTFGDRTCLIELLFGLYYSWLVGHALSNGNWVALPFLLVIQFGFLYVGLGSLAALARPPDPGAGGLGTGEELGAATAA